MVTPWYLILLLLLLLLPIHLLFKLVKKGPLRRRKRRRKLLMIGMFIDTFQCTELNFNPVLFCSVLGAAGTTGRWVASTCVCLFIVWGRRRE